MCETFEQRDILNLEGSVWPHIRRQLTCMLQDVPHIHLVRRPKVDGTTAAVAAAQYSRGCCPASLRRASSLKNTAFPPALPSPLIHRGDTRRVLIVLVRSPHRSHPSSLLVRWPCLPRSDRAKVFNAMVQNSTKPSEHFPLHHRCSQSRG